MLVTTLLRLTRYTARCLNNRLNLLGIHPMTKKQSARDRIALSLNPCPGRTETERQYIKRKLILIADEINYHLGTKAGQAQPKWLPPAVITPSQEAMYIESRERYENTDRDDDGYITDMDHARDLRATNRVRVATWYETPHNNELFMIALTIVSPLPCTTWGALPLTRSQWRIVIPGMIASHMHWKWIHAVREYWSDDNYQVGGTFGWFMEPCKKLPDDEVADLWIGQAIYAHVQRQYSDHVLEILATTCQSS